VKNSFDNGTAGQTITVANSAASGDPFNNAVGTMVYSPVAAHGGLGMEVTANASTLSYLGSTNQHSSSFAIRLASTPTANGLFYVARIGDGNSHAFRVLMTTARRIQLQNNATATVTPSLSSIALDLNTWYRLEFQCNVPVSGQSSTMAYGIYTLDGTTPLASYVNTAWNAGVNTNFHRAQLGRFSGTSWGTGPYFDDFVYLDSTTPTGPWTTGTANPWSLWTGSTEVPITMQGVWTGTAITPATYTIT